VCPSGYAPPSPHGGCGLQEDKPFRGLQKFGTAFLQRLVRFGGKPPTWCMVWFTLCGYVFQECSQCPSPILEAVTFVDTPGVLSGKRCKSALW
jgi:hypothetical protein